MFGTRVIRLHYYYSNYYGINTNEIEKGSDFADTM